MNLEVIPFTYNSKDELLAHTYVVLDKNNNAIVVDPSCNYDGIVNYLNKNKCQLKGILLTHSHFDHIGGVDKLVDAFLCPVFIHEYDEIGLTDEYYNCSEFCHLHLKVKAKAKTVIDNEILKIFSEEIKVIHTPFHSKGSCCYYFSNSKILFSGDTLFFRTIGRTDLPSSVPSLVNSSLSKLFNLADEVKVFPGHGKITNMKFEKNRNPYLRNL